MAYNDEITSSNLSTAMMEPEVYKPILQAAINGSAAMQLATQLPPMSRNTRNMNVMNVLPNAYWQSTGTSLKQTTDATWKNKTLTAEELAVMVPIAEDLLMDTENTGYDLFGELTPRIGEAIGKLVDQAVFHGTNLPSTWLTNTSGASASLLSGATSASHTVQSGTGTDIYDDIFGEAGVLSLVEADGFDATGMVGGLSTKGILRQVRAERTATGAGLPMFESNGASGEMTLGGYRCIFPKNNAIDATTAVLFSGDFSQLVYAIRQDITVKVITEGVISDDEGAILINLAQQDMVALRFVFRLGFQISNYVTQAQGTEGSRYPFAVLTPAGT
jgi:HK97 family phage major capsid protein